MIRALARRASATAKTWQALAVPNSSKTTRASPNACNSMSSSVRCSGQPMQNHGALDSIYRSIVLNRVKKKEYSWKIISQGFGVPAVFFSSRSSASFSAPNNAYGSSIVKWYLQKLDKYPVWTKSITAGSICTLADLTSQGISFASLGAFSFSDLDVERILRIAGYGFFLSGPTLHLWFNFMSKILPTRDVMSTIKKICLAQAVYGPIITTIFFSVNAYLQGETKSEIMARLQRDLIPIFVNGIMYWPICDFITYRYIPVHLQVLVSNSFAYVWTVYLTYIAGLKKVNAELMPAS